MVGSYYWHNSPPFLVFDIHKKGESKTSHRVGNFLFFSLFAIWIFFLKNLILWSELDNNNISYTSKISYQVFKMLFICLEYFVCDKV